MTRVARFGIGSIGALLLLAASACSVATGALDDDAAVDAAPAADASGPPSLGSERANDASDVCFDGLDNDFDDVLDCSEAECRAPSAACCVGSSETDCCMHEEPTTLSFAGCTGGALSTCDVIGDATVFGAEGPLVEAGRMVPVGGGAHAGVALGPRVAPRAAPVTLTATVHVPSSHCLDCVDLVGVALLGALPEGGAQASVAAGVFVIGARRELAVIVADEVVARAALAGDSAMLSLQVVDGEVSGMLGAVPFTIADVALPESVQPAVLGRSDGPSAASIGVTTASVQVPRCDSPHAIVRDRSARFPAEGSSWVPRGLGRLSVANVGATPAESRTWVALADGGRIELAPLDALRDGSFTPGELRAPAPAGAVRIYDPWLEAGDDGEVTLLYISEAESEDDSPGDTELYELHGPVDARLPLPGAPIAQASELGLAAIASPTRIQRAGGAPLLVLAGTLVEGGSRLLALEEVDGSWALRGGSIEAAAIAAPTPDDIFAFDSDGVGAPAILHAPTLDGSGTLLHLYYTGMRGTRPTIGLLVSQEGSSWRRIGRVLGPSAEGAVDAIGVTDAAPLVTEHGVELHYRGLGSADSAFGVAGAPGMIGE